MTGFGADTRTRKGLAITAEVRSINNRYLKVTTKLPTSLSGRDAEIEELVREALGRGSVEVRLRIDRVRGGLEARIDEKAAAAYHRAARRLSKALAGSDLPSIADILALPGVLVQGAEEDVSDEDWKLCKETVRSALKRNVASRATEGKRLGREIKRHHRVIATLVTKIRKRSPVVVDSYRARLSERITKALSGLGVTVSDSDFLREIALFADRSDVTEELDRLESHLDRFAAVIDGEGEVGRELDFVLQEMFREINTVGSKANDAAIAHLVVEAKVAVERIREQVQNLA
jgi:uncharacterized protein (TIGR00255 family)